MKRLGGYFGGYGRPVESIESMRGSPAGRVADGQKAEVAFFVRVLERLGGLAHLAIKDAVGHVLVVGLLRLGADVDGDLLDEGGHVEAQAAEEQLLDPRRVPAHASARNGA